MNQEQLNRKGQQYIIGLATAVSDLWHKCCEFDGIDPGAAFVTFSKRNPYQGFYNRAVAQFVRAKTEYACGGYVGLQIVQGKAR